MSHWYLIHGAASSRLTWTRQLKTLPAVQRASLPDLPDVAPPQLLKALTEWCLKDMREPSVVMGHSLGGAVAQLMALEAPHMVQGLVLVGTGPRLPVSPTLLEALQDDPPSALAKITRWSLARNPDPKLLALSLERMATVDPNRAYREFLACRSFDVRDSLPRISAHKAIIAAKEDRMTPQPLTQEFLDAWPDAPCFTMEHAGHMMMLEQPDSFNAILEQLIGRYRW